MAETKQHISLVTCGHIDAGKSLKFNTPILMFDGSIKMVQDIVKGDKIMCDNSTEGIVKLTTTGTDEMYDVIQMSGEKYTVTQDHVLVLKVSGYATNIEYSDDYYLATWLESYHIRAKKFNIFEYENASKAYDATNQFVEKDLPNFSGYMEPGQLIEIKAKDYYALPEKVKSLLTGFSTEVTFPSREEDIIMSPIMLGKFLKYNQTLEDIIKECKKYGCDEEITKSYLQKNNLLMDKHIPEEYKLGSIEIRRELLDSLCYNYDDTADVYLFDSEKLANDVMFISRSLGYHVTKMETIELTTPPKSFTSRIFGGTPNTKYYRFTVGVPLDVNKLTLIPVGKHTYYGFELEDNPRFLLGDFTVTHNSTTCGRLIFELGGIPQREMDKLQKEADNLGKSSFSFAFYMDNQKEERARGITISCATKEFYTDNYHYTIIDAPGHRDFIKNMISGASQADVGLLLVPADGNFTTSIARGNRKEGEVQGQSRQHARLINLLGVKQLIVGINKMDSDIAQYKEERYNEVKNEVKDMLLRVGWNKDFVNNSVAFIPYSGWEGDNLLKKSTNMPWWTGMDVKAIDGSMVHVETILDALNNYVKPPPRPVDKPLRAPISAVYNIKGIGQVYASRIEQGVVKPGDEVIFLPQHTEGNPSTGKIFSLEMHHKSQPEAKSGDNVGMSIKGISKDNAPTTGSVMIMKNDTTLRTVKRFTCTAQIIDHPNEIKTGYSPVVFCRTGRSACKLVKINWKLGKETGGKKLEDPVSVKQGDAAELVFEPQQPFVVEKFESCEGLSRVAALDGNGVVLLAKVTNIEF